MALAAMRSVPEAKPYRPPPDTGLAIAHADEHLLVLVKPEGLLSEPGRGEDKRDSLLTRAQARHPGVRIVHRLDMATSGLIVLALDAATHAALSAAFRERRVTKHYEALVRGPWPEGEGSAPEGEIDLPLAVDWPNRPRQVVCARTGRPALTRYRVLDAGGPGPARVGLWPVTGRTHQLRVHLAALGKPILGDPFYGPADPGTPRMMLHAVGLNFVHPATGVALDLASPAPF